MVRWPGTHPVACWLQSSVSVAPHSFGASVARDDDFVVVVEFFLLLLFIVHTIKHSSLSSSINSLFLSLWPDLYQFF